MKENVEGSRNNNPIITSYQHWPLLIRGRSQSTDGEIYLCVTQSMQGAIML